MFDSQILQGILCFVIAWFVMQEASIETHWTFRIPLQVIGLCMAGMGVCEFLVAFRVGL